MTDGGAMDPLNNRSYASMIAGGKGVLFSVCVSINISVGLNSDSSSPLYLRALHMLLFPTNASN